MNKHKKYCKYCGELFHPKRIDAIFCSASCRGLDNRRKNNPVLYPSGHKIEVRFSTEEFDRLCDDARRMFNTPEDQVKIIIRTHFNRKNINNS